MENPNNNKLEDLFNRRHSDSLDEFEKEALEGFEHLSSEEEALNAKADLDKKIFSKVFAEKKQSTRIYWFAAAGFLLIIGLSILFVNNNWLNEKNVAVNQDENLIKNPEGILEEKKTENSTSITDNNLEQKEKIEETHSGKSSRALIDKVIVDQKQKSEGQSKSIEAEEIKSESNSITSDNIAKDTEAIPSEEKPAPAPAKILSDEKNAAESGAKGAVTKAPVSEEFKNTSTKKTSEKRKEKSKKSALNQAAPAESDKDERYDDNLKNNYGEAEKMPPSSVASGKKEDQQNLDNVTLNCFYKGGELILFKDLKKELLKNNLDIKFDVILFIGKTKSVEKVNFINTFGMNNKQEKQITKILKSLSNFDFKSEPAGYYEYKLNYRP